MNLLATWNRQLAAALSKDESMVLDEEPLTVLQTPREAELTEQRETSTGGHSLLLVIGAIITIGRDIHA